MLLVRIFLRNKSLKINYKPEEINSFSGFLFQYILLIEFEYRCNIKHLSCQFVCFRGKKIMPPSHKGSKVHKEYFSCLVLTFLLDFVISKKNINHLRANSCVFVAKKNNATKTPRHKGSQRFLFLCSGDFLT